MCWILEVARSDQQRTDRAHTSENPTSTFRLFDDLRTPSDETHDTTKYKRRPGTLLPAYFPDHTRIYTRTIFPTDSHRSKRAETHHDRTRILLPQRNHN